MLHHCEFMMHELLFLFLAKVVINLSLYLSVLYFDITNIKSGRRAATIAIKTKQLEVLSRDRLCLRWIIERPLYHFWKWDNFNKQMRMNDVNVNASTTIRNVYVAAFLNSLLPCLYNFLTTGRFSNAHKRQSLCSSFELFGLHAVKIKSVAFSCEWFWLYVYQKIFVVSS